MVSSTNALPQTSIITKAFYIEFCHCSVFIRHLKWVLIVPKVPQSKTVQSYFQALLQHFISFLTQGRLSDCIRSSSSIWDCLPGVQRQAQSSSCVLFIRIGGPNKTDGLPNQPVSTYHDFLWWNWKILVRVEKTDLCATCRGLSLQSKLYTSVCCNFLSL